MAKSTVRKDIREAKEALRDLMLDHLGAIADDLVEKVVANYKKLPDSRKGDAFKGLSAKGFPQYKADFKSALAIISSDALAKARSEVPTKSKVKLSEWNEDVICLGEFEKLPPKIRKRLTNQIDILMSTQQADLEKVVMLQFSSSQESSDSATIIKADLYDSVGQWLDGPSVPAASGILSARTINETRQAFFFDDEVLEGIDAFIFKNDVPETAICEDLNGTIFAADDPGATRFYPPLHYNCDSYVLPILKGKLGNREIEKLAPSNAELEKQIQFHEGSCCGRVTIVDTH